MNIRDFRNFIFDMDGVLWHDTKPLADLAAFFGLLRDKQIQFAFATNNASKTIPQYLEKFGGFGVAVEPWQILTSAEMTGDYLLERFGRETAVYIIGTDGLQEAIRSRGFEIITREKMREGKFADVVVGGFSQKVIYDDFAGATININNGATFIGTNPDLTFPSPFGPLPGNGSLLALVTAATGVEPITVGKPGKIVFEQALKRLDSKPEETLMIGDRLNTDIVGADAAGLRTALVLSGISQQDEIADSPASPDFVFADINEMAQHL